MSLGRGIGSTTRRLLRAATAAAVAGMVLLGTAGTGAADQINSGGRATDVTLDGWPDLVARNASTGHLMVYPHSRQFNGTSTFQAPFSVGYGWGDANWIGRADVNGDGRSDVVARFSNGELYAYLHSGNPSGYNTFSTKILIGLGWNINDLLTIVDTNGDGRDDIIARRAGTGDLYRYPNTGALSTGMFDAPVYFGWNWQDSRWLQFSDMNDDGYLDIITHDGNTMFVVPTEPPPNEPRMAPKPKLSKIPAEGHSARSATAARSTAAADEPQPVVTGWGWDVADTVLIADVNKDGFEDIIARMKDGKLYAYPHSRSLNGTATFGAPVLLSWGWEVNDIIT
ncbi:FG-GAP repeat domain-containing protein [Streptoalloteichus tenebrarius]|nr:VCBS repeat-containing protein [Streptoalloteichus tenebrarius]BFF02859.1 hypothetical protein GCM10020241_45340 [Streptoalloteichus tenebrarius]